VALTNVYKLTTGLAPFFNVLRLASVILLQQ
jgi:hypothetical protein